MEYLEGGKSEGFNAKEILYISNDALLVPNAGRKKIVY
jgi:hypothetical protein